MANKKGFILPLSVLLVLVLTISGTGFMQHDYLERRMATNNVDNHGAFYLASAGLERARATLKANINPNGTLDWAAILNGTKPGYVVDSSPDPLLCPHAATRNCIILPFGPSVSAPGLPFDGTLTDGQYRVRAFNDAAEAGNADVNSIITIQAVGEMQGERKVLRVNVTARSGLNLINCEGEILAACPEESSGASLSYLDGREPASFPALPQWDQTYYHNPANLPCAASDTIAGDATFVPGPPVNPGDVQLQSDHCYFVSGDVTVQNVGAGFQRVVIFGDQSLRVTGSAGLTDSLLMSLGDLRLEGTVVTDALPPYPALIAGGNITKGLFSVQVVGAIVAEGSVGSSLGANNPNQVQGIIIGRDVFLNAPGTTVTDTANPLYYAFMPGFTYPDELIAAPAVPQTWEEIQ